MKKILSLVLLVAFTVALSTGCSSKKNELIMATEAGFAPYEYTEGGKIVGVDVDIANQIAKDMGKKLVISNMAFDAALVAVQQGKVDFAAAGISVTEERKQQMDFTIEYAVSKQVIVVNKSKKTITGEKDITDKTIVGVQQGNVADGYVKDNFKCKLNRYTSFLQASEDLKNNKIDCIVMDSLPAQQMVKLNQQLEILDKELFTDKYAIAVKKGNSEMLNAINKTLKKLVDEGKVQEFTINHTTK